MVNPDNTKIRFEPSEDSDYVADSKEVKPILGPKPTKDFKKVMSKTGRQGKEGEDELLKKVSSKEFDEEAGEQAGVMGIRTKKRKDNTDNDEDGPVSLFDLSKRAAQKDRQEREGGKKEDFIAAVETPKETVKEAPETKEEFNPYTEESKKDRFTTRYTPEQPDISYVNPLAATSIQAPSPLQPVASGAKIERPQPVTTAMQEICAQLVKQMYTVETKGQTDTVVILQYPPLFKDAKIVVSSYESAKGQFNITFENLTQAAQLVLDKDENRQILLDTLEKRGYNVQIMTTTTTISENAPVSDEKPLHRERDGQGGGQGRGSEDERDRDETG
jgi:hypothetical protein